MALDIFIPNQEQWKAIKQAIGIDANTSCQKIVIELEANKVAKVYVKALGPRRLMNGVLGLLAVEPVADVTVSEAGDVEAKPCRNEY